MSWMGTDVFNFYFIDEKTEIRGCQVITPPTSAPSSTLLRRPRSPRPRGPVTFSPAETLPVSFSPCLSVSCTTFRMPLLASSWTPSLCLRILGLSIHIWQLPWAVGAEQRRPGETRDRKAFSEVSEHAHVPLHSSNSQTLSAFASGMWASVSGTWASV